MRSFSTYIHLYRKNIKMSLSSNLVTMKHMLVVEKNIKIWQVKEKKIEVGREEEGDNDGRGDK